MKLNQQLKGYSDERRKGLLKFPDYTITFKHYYASKGEKDAHYLLDIKLSTPVRAYEVEPVLYLKAADKIQRIEASENILKTYQEGSSSTSSETSSSISDDPENEGDELVETKTTYTSSSSHNTYQLMQLRFYPEKELLEEIAHAKKTRFRLYIDNEVIDIPLKGRDKRKFEKYIELLPQKDWS